MTKSRTSIFVLSGAGILAMAYLLFLHIAPTVAGDSLFCTVGEHISCLSVNKSAYSIILGIPMSVLGLLYFVFVFFINGFKLTKKQYGWLALLTIVLLGPSIYLTLIETFVLKVFCLYCEFSKLCMLGIVGFSIKQSQDDRPDNNQIFFASAAALLLAAVTYYLQV